MCSNLSDITIVIPSFNRQKNLIGRLIALREFPGNVIAIDGTKNPISDKNIELLPENVKYLHSNTGMGERFKIAEEHINSKYVINLGDDDMLLTASLANLLRVLENETSQIVTGHALITYRIGNSWEFNLYKPDYYPMKNYQINDLSEEERILKHMKKYVCTSFYALMKKETWRKIYCSGIDFNSLMKSPFLHEIGWEILAAMSGGIKVTDDLLWLRLNDGPAAWESENIDKKSILTVTEMLGNSQHLDELNNFINRMKKIFEMYSNNSYDSENLIRKCLAIFSELENSKKQQKISQKDKIIKVWDKIHIKIRITINKSYMKFSIKSSNQILQKNLNKAIKILNENEIIFDEVELEAMSQQLQTR